MGWGVGNGACWGERQGRAGELGGTARCNGVGVGNGACWGERQGRAGELGGTARCNGVGCRQWGVLG